MADRISASTGRAVEVVGADLTLKADQQRVEHRLQSDERITLLVNNAGVGATSPLVDSDVDSLDNMIQLNVTALTRLTRAVARGMGRSRQRRNHQYRVDRGGGAGRDQWHIQRQQGLRALAFTQSLHHELGPKGIQVQAVLPGATSTDFWEVAGVPVSHLPNEIVMGVEEMVDAALVGFDRKELVTIPSLPDTCDWDAFDGHARRSAQPFAVVSAARYQA